MNVEINGENKIVSDECSVLKTSDKVLSMVLNIAPAKKDQPMTVIDRKESKIKMRITDTNQQVPKDPSDASKGKTSLRLEYNFEVHLFRILNNLATEAAKTYGKDVSVPLPPKIFGDGGMPGQGMAYETMCQIVHKTKAPDGSIMRYPWKVSITSGITKVQKNANGSQYGVSGTFQKKSEACFNISDTDMFKLCSETNDALETLITGSRKPMLFAYSTMYKERQQRMQSAKAMSKK